MAANGSCVTHVEAAQTHLLKVVYLTQQLVFLELSVPCPERTTPVLGRGILKKLRIERRGTLGVSEGIGRFRIELPPLAVRFSSDGEGPRGRGHPVRCKQSVE
jgi:hypothetical protein